MASCALWCLYTFAYVPLAVRCYDRSSFDDNVGGIVLAAEFNCFYLAFGILHSLLVVALLVRLVLSRPERLPVGNAGEGETERHAT
jgi:hypothetical protein